MIIKSDQYNKIYIHLKDFALYTTRRKGREEIVISLGGNYIILLKVLTNDKYDRNKFLLYSAAGHSMKGSQNLG